MKTWLFLWIVVQLFNLLYFSSYVLLLLRKNPMFSWLCVCELLPILIMSVSSPGKPHVFLTVCVWTITNSDYVRCPSQENPMFPWLCVYVSLPVLVIFNVLLRKTPCFPKCVCTVTNPVCANCYRFRICSLLSPGKPHVLLTVCMCVPVILERTLVLLRT